MEREASDYELDVIYESIDSLCRNENFKAINNVLENIDIPNFTLDILIGYLTITKPAEKNLPYRSEFYKKVETEFRNRGYEGIEGLLFGLE